MDEAVFHDDRIFTAFAVHHVLQAFDTALTIASRRQHKEIFDELLQFGAVPTRKEAEILLDADRLDILKQYVRGMVFGFPRAKLNA